MTTTVKACDRVMPTPDIDVPADIVDMPHSVCDCERQTGTVVEVRWLVGTFNPPTGRDALENGPEWVLDEDTVRSGVPDVDWVRCCAWCYPGVVEDALDAAMEDTLEIRVSRAWVAISGARVAA